MMMIIIIIIMRSSIIIPYSLGCSAAIAVTDRSVAVGIRLFRPRRRRWSAACTCSWATRTLRQSRSSGGSSSRRRSGSVTCWQRTGEREQFIRCACDLPTFSSSRVGSIGPFIYHYDVGRRERRGDMTWHRARLSLAWLCHLHVF